MSKNRVYAYARVSTRQQNEARQLLAWREMKINPKNVYIDKQSGKDFDRTEYQELMKVLQPNDVLVIKSIDRLGRNYREVLEQWRALTKERCVDVVVLDMPLLDTRQQKDLLGAFISDVVLQILSFVAQNERENIIQRQREGIAAAKARGVKFGRPMRELPRQFHLYVALWHAKRITGVAAAKACQLPLSTFRNRAKKYLSEKNSNNVNKSSNKKSNRV